MRSLTLLILATFLCLSLHFDIIAGKKKKKSKKSSNDSDESIKFDTNMLKCLVCQNLITEFETAIWRTDPKKKVDKAVSYRDKNDGIHKRVAVSTCAICMKYSRLPNSR